MDDEIKTCIVCGNFSTEVLCKDCAEVSDAYVDSLQAQIEKYFAGDFA